MIRRPPRSTRTYTLLPCPTLCRSAATLKSDPVRRWQSKQLHSETFVGSPEHSSLSVRQWQSACRIIAALQQVATSNASGRRPWDAIARGPRSEEHPSELKSLMRTSYYVIFLTNKKSNAHN